MSSSGVPNIVVEPTVSLKPCPYCGELLKAGVVVCRYCQRDLFNPDAPPIVGLHDWERAKPPEKVVYTVRLPVSELQWAMTCYALTAAVGAFWIATLLRPVPTPYREPSPLPVRRSGRVMGISASKAASPSSAGGTLNEFVAVPSPSLKTLDESSGEKALPSPATEEAPLPSPSVEKAPMVSMGSSVSAPELVAAFNTEMDRAVERYTHHQVTVTGRVIGSGRSAEKTAFVLLQGTDDTQVKCFLTPEAGKDVPSFPVGSEIKLTGTCEGRFVDVTLSHCRLEL